MIPRKKYSKEFKLDAIALVTGEGYTCQNAAQSLSISPQMLARWIRESKTLQDAAFRGNGKLNAEQLELRLLREEIKRLKMEKDILKKATVFFAQLAK